MALKHEITKAMNEVNVKVLRPSGYELFVKACARKAFQHEQEEGPDADVITFIKNMEHGNSDDIWEKHCELRSDYHRANVYPSPVDGKCLSEKQFKEKWGMSL